MSLRARIPVTLLSGFLGAGKTTLLNHVLGGAGALRIAVIENELGELGVDQLLIEGADAALIELNDGCLCCTVLDDLARVLRRLLDRRGRFDHVVIEATGLADPGPVIACLASDGLRPHFELAGVVTVVDVSSVERDLEEHAVCVRQIALADLLVLNKTDRVDPSRLDALEARLRRINGLAACVRTVRSRAAVAAVLRRYASLPLRPLAAPHTHDGDLACVVIEMEGEVEIDALDRWLGALLRQLWILRFKGVLAVPGHPRRFVVQGVRQWVDVATHTPWGDEPRRNRLVFIGRGLDPLELRRGLADCMLDLPTGDAPGARAW